MFLLGEFGTDQLGVNHTHATGRERFIERERDSRSYRPRDERDEYGPSRSYDRDVDRRGDRIDRIDRDRFERPRDIRDERRDRDRDERRDRERERGRDDHEAHSDVPYREERPYDRRGMSPS